MNKLNGKYYKTILFTISGLVIIIILYFAELIFIFHPILLINDTQEYYIGRLIGSTSPIKKINIKPNSIRITTTFFRAADFFEDDVNNRAYEVTSSDYKIFGVIRFSQMKERDAI